MKTQIVSVLIAVPILLISFQNCQKPPYPDEINTNNLSSNAINKIDLNQKAIESVNLTIKDSKMVTQANRTYQLIYNKNLSIDLNTGVITQTDDTGGASANYCLSESLKNELVAILKSSQICNAQPDLPEGTMCTQVMRTAYAQLITNNEQFDLGSATDGCGSNSVDLCGEQSNLLKGYIENLKNKYQQMSCP